MRRGKKHASEGLTETREGALNWLKNYLPTWPEYVLRDWLYRNLTKIDPGENPKEVVDRSISGEGMSAQTQWKLVPNFEFKIEKLHPDTQRRIKIRAGGSSNPMKVPKDAERHATQAALAQQQGGVRKEPVIGKMTPQGFELIEGWHRTIQHFKQFPNGYRGPAWIAMNARTTEDVEEGWKSKAAGAAMVGLSALGAAGHAKADNQDAKASTHISQDLPGKIAGSSYPTRAPVGTLYGSFIDKDGRKINKYVDSELTTKFKPDDEGPWDPQKYPTRAPVGTKYGSFVDKDGKKWDKYVGPELTAIFKPAKDEVGEAVTTNYSRGEELEGIDIMGAPVFISYHAIERLDRKGERSVDVEEIYEIIEKAVKQHGRDIAKLHNIDFMLKGENGPPREPKNGFGIALAKNEDSAGNPIYMIKTVHPRLLANNLPGFKVQGLKRRYSMYEDATTLESTLIGSLPSNKERWAPQVRGEKSAGDVAKKSQKPGVPNQKHPFQGRLVGGS
jgi:hypothetical protein